jgi:exopolysaccharide biosynthesis WecB/TagA/CpsF family protein
MHFAAFVSEAELVVADGMPLIWASRIQGTPLPQRVAGSDLILTLSAAAAKAGRSIYLLGGAPGTAEGASQVLRSNYPGLQIAGMYCPPIGFEQNEAEMARMIHDLTTTKPEIVFVALGSPKQEQLIERIRANLPNAWWLGVGVSFSFLTGHVQRAPRLLQRSGLEWVHRLFQEPRRLFKRYVVQGLPFACTLFGSAVSQRVRSWAGHRGDGPARRYARRSSGYALPTFSRRADLLADAVSGLEGVNALVNGDATSRLVDDSSLARPRDPAVSTRGNRDLSSGGGLSRLRAIVMLGGQLRPSPLQLTVNRSVLDLPVLEDRTLINHWLADAVELASYAKLDRLGIKLMVSRAIDEPASVIPRYRELLTVERDASEYRGTGGVIADIAQRYGDDDFILVANAAQLLLEPLPALASALDHKRADVSMLSHLDGTPGGLMLIRCAALRGIGRRGFIDLKEQALASIAKHFDVRVVHCRRPTGLPLRTTFDYVSALRQWHRGPGRLPGSRRGQIDPLAEDFSRGFMLVESGALVDSTAYLHDAVVLRGARVEANASVVRSLIGPNRHVKRDIRVIDDFASL